MKDYTPEMICMILASIYNIVLVVVCGKTTIELYKLSGSLHSLWALLMLFAIIRSNFVRD